MEPIRQLFSPGEEEVKSASTHSAVSNPSAADLDDINQRLLVFEAGQNQSTRILDDRLAQLETMFSKVEPLLLQLTLSSANNNGTPPISTGTVPAQTPATQSASAPASAKPAATAPSANSNFQTGLAFSGGTPYKRDPAPRLPMSLRDSRSAALVQKECAQGISTSYVFKGDSAEIITFMQLLVSRAHELGVEEALWTEVNGIWYNLPHDWMRVSVEQVREHQRLLEQRSATDSEAARLLTEFSFLKILIMNSIDPTQHLTLTTNCDSLDQGPTVLRQLLKQSGGSHQVLITNYQRDFTACKLIDIPGCSMQTYSDRITPILLILHRTDHFPLSAAQTLLANTGGTLSEPFNMVRTNFTLRAYALMNRDEEFALVQEITHNLTNVYTDEMKSGRWEHTTKSSEVHLLSKSVDSLSSKVKFLEDNNKKNKKSNRSNKNSKSNRSTKSNKDEGSKNKDPSEWGQPQHGDVARMYKNVMWLWCGRCKCWNKDHLIARCPKKKKQEECDDSTVVSASSHTSASQASQVDVTLAAVSATEDGWCLSPGYDIL